MSRSRFVLAVLALSLVAQACTVDVDEANMEGCEDLSVGEQAELEVVDISEYERPVDGSEAQWTHESGPGTLEADSDAFNRAQYTATEPGSVVITWYYIRLTGYEFGINSRPLLIATSSLTTSARCALEVFDAAVTPAEGVGYEVTAVVTVSTVEGLLAVGSESVASWRLLFDCPDSRCDAEVHDGGPFGGMAPFIANYQDDVENFVFDFVLDTPANEECGDDRWVGEITPLSWDEEGPLGFSFRMVNVLTCDSGDIVVEWVGEGTRG